MAILYAKTAGGNWSAAGTWSTTGAGGADNSGPPAATTDVIFELLSGNVTIDAASSCRSLDTTSGTGTFGGTITHNAFALSIGDGTAGAGSVALKFNSGITYTVVSGTTSSISFISTSGTNQSVDFGGKTTGPVTFNGTGQWYFATNVTIGTPGTLGGLTLTKGTLHVDGASDNSGLSHTIVSINTGVNQTRTLNLGTATITSAATGNTNIFNAGSGTTGLTFNAGTSSINWTGSGGVNINASTLTLYDLSFNGSGSVLVTNAGGFHNLTVNGSGIKTDLVTFAIDFTVTNVLTFAGNSVTNRLLVASSVIGTQRTITNTGATMTWSNVDIRDIGLTTSFNAAAITGNSGDCGGNSNITFTTGSAQTSTGTSSFTWSTHGWTTRVPLPQDDVTVSNAFSAGQTITMDMPRLGKSITFSSSSNAVTLSDTIASSIFGSLTLNSFSTMTSWTGAKTMEGRSSYTITSAGKNHASINFNAPGGTYQIQDALSLTTATTSTFTLSMGTFDANNFNVSAGLFTISGTGTRTLTMGSGTWTYTTSSASGTPWNAATTTGLTFNPNTSTIKCTTNSSSTKPFSGGGLTYNNVWFADSSTGADNMIGSNTFNDLQINAGRTLNFTAATTTTVTTFTATGSSGNTITIGSITAAGHTLTKSGGGVISCDWLVISRSTATPGTTWYAGANSTDNGNNSGWIFTIPPAATGTGWYSSKGGWF